MKLITLTALALSFVSLSCAKRTEFQSYGLEKIEIRMDSAYVGEMIRGAPEKLFYPGRAIINGKNYVISMQPAGNSTIREPKKSWDIEFPGKDSPFGTNQIRLASTIKDRSLLATPLSLAVFKAAGLPTSSITPTFLYLNDMVLGAYYRIEKVDDHFLDHRKILWHRYYETQDGANFEPNMVLRLKTAFKVRPEKDNAELMAMLTRITELPSDADFESQVFNLMDRTTVVNYLSASLIANHFDGFEKNLYFIETAEGNIKIVPWDFDLDWYGKNSSSSSFAATIDLTPWQGSYLFRRIAILPSIQSAVATQTAALIAGPCSFANLKAVADQYRAKIRDAYAADPALGGAGSSIDTEGDALLNTVQERLNNL